MKFKRGFFLKHLEEKAIAEAKKVLTKFGDVAPLRSVILCEGSKTTPGCQDPLFTNTLMKKCRDHVINGLANSKNRECELLAVEITPLCLGCVVDHPELKPYIPKKEMTMINIARKIKI